MSRPNIIRADTIDLQDHTAPSAKDHSRQPSQPSALGEGPPAPHQAESLTQAAADDPFEEQYRVLDESPNWVEQEHEGHGRTDSDDGYYQHDALAIAQNGGLAGSGAEDADMTDAEGNDDDLDDDDDDMDKISSSPSIDDGGYSPALSRSPRRDSSSPSDPDPYMMSHQLPSMGKSDSPSYSEHSAKDPRLGHGQLRVSVDSLATEYGVWKHGESALCPEDVEAYDDAYESDGSRDPLAVQLGLAMDSSDDSSEDSYGDGDLCFPYESSDEGDDDFPYPEDPRFIDSGWIGDCLHDTEDIDFEFVYALHTFVATVEGQANASKGDTMVLLDDSNSYWWLVRVVKDTSIGYLPAEHIETPTERLARLNKHRNIDLSATMLTDQSDKLKNPLKKAILRRNAKNVTFNQTHIYVEASEAEYSTDEDMDDDNYFAYQDDKAESEKDDEDEITSAEPERTEPREAAGSADDGKPGASQGEAEIQTIRSSEESVDGVKSRGGTARPNTDSFLKDDSAETRKITITPNILREQSNSPARPSNESNSLRQVPSQEKEVEPVAEKPKDKKASKDKSKEKKDKDKKDKDRKPHMLSGLFKRKDKRSRDEDVHDLIMGTSEGPISPTLSAESDEEAMQSLNASPPKQQSKLQKRRDSSPVRAKLAEAKSPELEPAQESDRAPNSLRLVQQGAPGAPPLTRERSTSSTQDAQPQQGRERSASATQSPPTGREHSSSIQSALSGRSFFSQNSERPGSASRNTQEAEAPKAGDGVLSKVLRGRSRSNSESKPEKTVQARGRLELDDAESKPEDTVEAKELDDSESKPEHIVQAKELDDSESKPEKTVQARGRLELDDSDSDEELEANEDPPQRPAPLAQAQARPAEHRADSPEQASPDEASRQPPALTASNPDEAPSPASTPSPEPARAEEGASKAESGPAWSDAHLRTYLEDDSEIRDLLVVVYDKTGVEPAGPDHPVTGSLFRAENAKLADITNRLDNMLGDWLARKRTMLSR